MDLDCWLTAIAFEFDQAPAVGALFPFDPGGGDSAKWLHGLMVNGTSTSASRTISSVSGRQGQKCPAHVWAESLTMWPGGPQTKIRGNCKSGIERLFEMSGVPGWRPPGQQIQGAR
jgi:hypothetical protein